MSESTPLYQSWYMIRNYLCLLFSNNPYFLIIIEKNLFSSGLSAVDYSYEIGPTGESCRIEAVSARSFRNRDDGSFKKVFRRNLPVVFPNWFVPFAVAVYLLLTRYSTEALLLTISFFLIGFVIIPLISKFVGCRNCEIKEDCLWMADNKKG
jgi:hypothetical protein